MQTKYWKTAALVFAVLLMVSLLGNLVLGLSLISKTNAPVVVRQVEVTRVVIDAPEEGEIPVTLIYEEVEVTRIVEVTPEPETTAEEDTDLTELDGVSIASVITSTHTATITENAVVYLSHSRNGSVCGASTDDATKYYVPEGAEVRVWTRSVDGMLHITAEETQINGTGAVGIALTGWIAEARTYHDWSLEDVATVEELFVGSSALCSYAEAPAEVPMSETCIVPNGKVAWHNPHSPISPSWGGLGFGVTLLSSDPIVANPIRWGTEASDNIKINVQAIEPQGGCYALAVTVYGFHTDDAGNVGNVVDVLQLGSTYVNAVPFTNFANPDSRIWVKVVPYETNE
ncbi:MAG: hypothetical protein ACOZAO_00505 [Patescibacteria group bacterium]